MYTSMYKYIYMYMYTYMYMHMCIYICICVCMCVYKYMYMLRLSVLCSTGQDNVHGIRLRVVGGHYDNLSPCIDSDNSSPRLANGLT